MKTKIAVPILVCSLTAALAWWGYSTREVRTARPVAASNSKAPVEPQRLKTPRRWQAERFGPPTKKGLEILHFPYTNTDAGDVDSRGTYPEVGTDISGNPYGFNGIRYLRWYGFNWIIASDMTSEPVWYYSCPAEDVNTFPLTGWSTSTGASPAPTWATGARQTVPQGRSNIIPAESADGTSYDWEIFNSGSFTVANSSAPGGWDVTARSNAECTVHAPWNATIATNYLVVWFGDTGDYLAHFDVVAGPASRGNATGGRWRQQRRRAAGG